MSEPWINDDWICFDVDLVVDLTHVAAMIRTDSGVEVFLQGAFHAHPIIISNSAQASNVWREAADGDPTETGWIVVAVGLAIHLSHLAAVERTPTGIRFHVDSNAATNDARFILPRGAASDEFYGRVFQSANKAILVVNRAAH